MQAAVRLSSCRPSLQGCFWYEVMRLSAVPETCCRAAALSQLYIAMGENFRSWETTALIHGLGRFVSSPSTFPVHSMLQGGRHAPKNRGVLSWQLCVPGPLWCAVVRAGTSQPLLPHTTSCTETRALPFGSSSSPTYRVQGCCLLPAMLNFSWDCMVCSSPRALSPILLCC